ncbi:MAG: protoporphyrinogen oxidase [Firmicutes bacterium]|nr:protoporphyrinogen oxidase [Bacillota bacterium]
MSTPSAGIWRLAVVGGGVTGLSAALQAIELAEAAGQRIAVTLYESTRRLGGKVQTLHRDEGTLELGADSFLARKDPVMRLCRKLGLDREWVGTGPQAKQTWLVADRQLHPFPSGTYMGIPVWEEGILSSPFLSEQGKRRALMDLEMPDGSPDGDESIRAFLVRRFGDEMVDRIADAVMSGIYGGRSEDLSLLATFPEFRVMERTHGSVLRGMQARLANAQAAATSAPLSRSIAMQGKAVGTGVVPPASVFLTLRSGLETLVEALESRLIALGADLQVGVKVSSLERQSVSLRETPYYRVSTEDGSARDYDAIVLATPAYVTADLLEHPEVSAQLRAIRYASVATVLLLYRAKDLASMPQGSGFVVPRREQMTVTAVTWLSAKWPTSLSDEVIALRAFVGRSEAADIVSADDDEIKRQVQEDLAVLMGDTIGEARPYDIVITRWPHAMPQYDVGHRERVQALLGRATQTFPGLALAGAAYAGGVGIPDCIEQGEQAAKRLFDERTVRADS